MKAGWLAAGALVACLALAACGGDDGGGNQETFCDKVRQFNADTQTFDLNLAAEAEVEQVAALLDEIREAAPEQISEDIDTRFAYVDDVIAASQGDDDAAGRLSEAEPTDEAQDRINAYTQEACNITLEPAGPPATPVPTSPPTTLPTTTLPPTTIPSTAPPTTLAPA